MDISRNRELPESLEEIWGSLRVPLTRVFGLGFRVYGFEFNVYGLGCMVWSLGFKVWGLGFGV